VETANNHLLSLSELRGNYVLLHFWASWSKPSVEENLSVNKCFQQFGKNNFIIVQASLDNSRENWINAIGNQSEGWYHVSDLLRWESIIVKLFGIEKIPSNFLIDPNGTIVEKDNFGEDLIKVVGKYFD
jgi:peroxiredoxin